MAQSPTQNFSDLLQEYLVYQLGTNSKLKIHIYSLLLTVIHYQEGMTLTVSYTITGTQSFINTFSTLVDWLALTIWVLLIYMLIVCYKRAVFKRFFSITLILQ